MLSSIKTSCSNNLNSVNKNKLVKAQIPLRRLCDSPGQVPDKVTDTNHESLRHKSRRRLSWFVSVTSPGQVTDKVTDLSRTLPWTLPPTFSVHCNGLNSIRATQTCLSRIHLDMSRWFVSATFVICVGNFHQNFMVSWFVTVCVCNFHDLCPRLSSLGSFGESRHTGIWA